LSEKALILYDLRELSIRRPKVCSDTHTKFLVLNSFQSERMPPPPDQPHVWLSDFGLSGHNDAASVATFLTTCDFRAPELNPLDLQTKQITDDLDVARKEGKVGLVKDYNNELEAEKRKRLPLMEKADVFSFGVIALTVRFIFLSLSSVTERCRSWQDG
jgi:hypothetical protein